MAIHAPTTAQDAFLERLEAGEDNPYLVYELCKRWRPGSLSKLMARMPGSVDRQTIIDGWNEYKGTRRR